MGEDWLHIHCPAKVNLALSVGSAEASGYHPLASWMVGLDFGDTLALRRAEEGIGRLVRQVAADAPRAFGIDWPEEADLAWRAHRLLEREAGRVLPAEVCLSKRIPPGAGLGGGSSDAAGVLTGLNELFDLGLGRARLIALAGELGSDVAFLVRACLGEPSACVEGLGERIEPRGAGPIHLVVWMPELHCSTGAVYQAFDAEGGDQADGAAIRRLIDDWPDSAAGVFNDLAAPAERVQPALGEVRRTLAAAVGQAVHVTGSGAGLFAVASSDAGARTILSRSQVTGVAGVTAGLLPGRTPPGVGS